MIFIIVGGKTQSEKVGHRKKGELKKMTGRQLLTTKLDSHRGREVV